MVMPLDLAMLLNSLQPLSLALPPLFQVRVRLSFLMQHGARPSQFSTKYLRCRMIFYVSKSLGRPTTAYGHIYIIHTYIHQLLWFWQ